MDIRIDNILSLEIVYVILEKILRSLDVNDVEANGCLQNATKVINEGSVLSKEGMGLQVPVIINTEEGCQKGRIGVKVNLTHMDIKSILGKTLIHGDKVDFMDEGVDGSRLLSVNSVFNSMPVRV